MHTIGIDFGTLSGRAVLVRVADGTVVATGYDLYGQCDVKGWTDIVAIDTGDYHTLGLKANGTVVAIGQNSTGNNFKGRRCDLSIWTNVVTVSGGRGHTIGLRTDGSVLAVGYNDNGQCDMPGWAGWKDIRMPQRPTPFR